MRVIERLVLYKFILFFAFSVTVQAGNFPNKTVDKIINQGADFLLNHNYEAARYKFIELNKLYPKIPLGKIYLAVLEISKAVDYAEKINETKIEKLLNDAKDLSDSLYESNKKDLWNNYYVALSCGYYAYYKGMVGDYLSAFSNGVTSISYYEKCLNIDSLFYDSYIALGTYYYWKSAKTKSLSWLPFVNDDRALGKRLLEKAINKDTYGHFLGAYSLVWIYIENKEYSKAIKLCEEVLSMYPKNRLFKLSLARIYTELDKNKAISIYQEVLKSIMELDNNNHVTEIELKHKIAMQYNDLGNYKKALEYCNNILGIKLKDSYSKEQVAKRLQRVRSLKEELKEKLNN